MFNKKPISNSISALEKRICDLETPYQFKVGDLVEGEIVRGCIEIVTGTIVEIKHNYFNDYDRFSSNILYISRDILDKFISKSYERENLYYVYIGERKETIWIGEKQIKLK